MQQFRQMSKTTKRILKMIGWVVATPLILVLLLFVALYIPPVQKWAVDMTADYLSKETGMEVSVERVLLKFPLDLSMGNVKIRAKGKGQKAKDPLADEVKITVLDAEELLMDVQFWPLLNGEVKVNHAILTNTKVNTLDLIDAMRLEYKGKKLELRDVNWNLNSGHMSVPTLALDHSDISISMADSVPEDTTEEGSNLLKK